MTSIHFALFETEIGTCALAWGEKGLVSVQLPSADAHALRARMKRLLPGAVEAVAPPQVAKAVAGIQALLAGEPVDLGWIELDNGTIPDFNRQVYAIARAIPRGSTMTYGEVAKKLGDPLLAQAVGKAMGQNPHPIVMPCHRVMGKSGDLTGYHWGLTRKCAMLGWEAGKVAA